jgi:hypothetical protein
MPNTTGKTRPLQLRIPTAALVELERRALGASLSVRHYIAAVLGQAVAENASCLNVGGVTPPVSGRSTTGFPSQAAVAGVTPSARVASTVTGVTPYGDR